MSQQLTLDGMPVSSPEKQPRESEKTQDITRNYHQNADTSILANPSAQSKERDKTRILASLKRAGEASCQRLEIVTGIPHETCSARLSEMKRDGQVIVCGYGTTIAGNKCRLYKIV